MQRFEHLQHYVRHKLQAANTIVCLLTATILTIVGVTDVQAQTQTFELQGAGAYNAEEILSFAAQLELQRTGAVTAAGIARTS